MHVAFLVIISSKINNTVLSWPWVWSLGFTSKNDITSMFSIQVTSCEIQLSVFSGFWKLILK